ncbi:PREDICTED: probable thionin-2.4 [Camelina sativa]|uniref:Probable thionin-2.4 n=1 Tax=Camelina sativa TaxID=90675 RepID=A0ABM0SYX9_CAMSA|nr:PREDICTED: probable thionin-2.4 [Camelina sativa]
MSSFITILSTQALNTKGFSKLNIYCVIKQVISPKMEGKTLILSVLMMSLFMAQIQVEARSCCPSLIARNFYKHCRSEGGARIICATQSGCILFDGQHLGPCPNKFPYDSLEDGVNEYCKLGCVSSLCGAIKALTNSDTSEIGNGSADNCANACSTLCTKSSTTGVETA